MDIESLISMLKTQQLPYKKINAGDFIYDLAPKKISVNHKIAIPDILRELLGDTTNINIIGVSNVDSLWHSLLYGLLTDKYNKLNWHYRKLLVEKFVQALDQRSNSLIVNSPILKYSNLKQDVINFKEVNVELMFYISLVLNINIVVYNCGLVDRVQYHFPTAKYNPDLPLILLYCNDVPQYSIISVNDQLIFDYASYTSQQIAKNAPLEHKVLKYYLNKKCPSDLYAEIHGIDIVESNLIAKRASLLKFKTAELKELYMKLTRGSLSLPSGRLTKEVLVNMILEINNDNC
jgi:hypothetical protein